MKKSPSLLISLFSVSLRGENEKQEECDQPGNLAVPSVSLRGFSSFSSV